MIEGCALNGNFFGCMAHYHPWYLALFALTIVGIAIIWRAWRNP
jgi:hypothetical protein